MENLRVCVLLIGQMRTYNSPQIRDSYLKFFNKMNIDVYITTWKKRGASNHHGFNDVDTSKENDTISVDMLYEYYRHIPVFNIKNIDINDDDIWYNHLDNNLRNIYDSKFLNPATGKIYNPKHTTSVPIEYLYQRAVKFIPLNHIYDRVIVMRPDMEIVDTFRISTNNDCNTIYYQCDCVPCIDHGWFSSHKTILLHLSDIYDNYLANKKNANSVDNNVLLLHQAKRHNIKIFAYPTQLFNQIL